MNDHSPLHQEIRMPAKNKLVHKERVKSGFSKEEDESELIASLILKKRRKILINKKQGSKFKSPVKVRGSTLSKKKFTKSSSFVTKNGFSNGKVANSDMLHRKRRDKTLAEKLSLLKSRRKKKSAPCQPKENGEKTDGAVSLEKPKKKRKKKGRNNLVELDEASRLQRRTRYLLIKMKLEQNLIDAYSGEGWKGQSREKIKPVKELQRAKKQILNCKLGIRDIIRQLESLGSKGSIEDSLTALDGSVHHEHISCAKCKQHETSPGNDIIRCDGACNSAFHQKCVEPPLDTKSIPSGDQGWLCKPCECKMDILGAMNAHLGTSFSFDSNWEDIFREEAALLEGGIHLVNAEEEWPSDDSEDDDYDPERRHSSADISGADSDGSDSCEASSSTSLSWSLDAEVISGSRIVEEGMDYANGGLESDGANDADIICGPRQRSAVDYKKLYDEMFGKDAPTLEQASEDEDWGPTKRRCREKESDAANTLITLSESEKKGPRVEALNGNNNLHAEEKGRKSVFRIPPGAVEKLREVFAKDELPSRSVREDLSKELGLMPEKVNRWFKNARYVALKTRKAEKADHCPKSPEMHKEPKLVQTTEKPVDLVASKDALIPTNSNPSKDFEKVNKKYDAKPSTSNAKKIQHQRGSQLSRQNKEKVVMEFDDDVCLKKHLKLLREKTKKDKKRVGAAVSNGLHKPEIELKRLCKIQSRLDSLRQKLIMSRKGKSKTSDESPPNGASIIYVPVTELKEKA